MTGDISVHRCYIEAALKYADGSHMFEDVAAAVAAGRMQYWPGPSSAIITEILDYPQYKALNFFLAGGNLPELERMTPLILEWGKAQGCKKALFAGRRGWERTFLTRSGWGVSDLVVLEKAIDE